MVDCSFLMGGSKLALTLRKLAEYSGDPWTPDNSYFSTAERAFDPIWDQLIWPFIKGCNFSRVIDLAAGHGRNSTKLVKLCDTLTLMDIQPENVSICRERFKDHRHVQALTNSGYDLQPVEDGDTTLVYCFDAMVHFDSDVVRSYLCDTFRVLADGGRGFFHHSNYIGGDDWRLNPGSRGFMSAEFFAHYARKEGLQLVQQTIIDWGGVRNLDCMTLVEKS